MYYDSPKKRTLPPNRLILLLILAVSLVSVAVGRTHGGTPAPSQSAMPVPVPPATQPTATPTPTTSVAQPAPVLRAKVPVTPAEVAAEFGGSPGEWSKGPDELGRTVGPNGFIYRSHGTQQLYFVVPQGMVVDTAEGRRFAGAPINATDLTIYWL